MFEQSKSEGYFKRIANALTALPREYLALLLCGVILLVPFPTTVVPEWKVRAKQRLSFGVVR